MRPEGQGGHVERLRVVAVHLVARPAEPDQVRKCHFPRMARPPVLCGPPGFAAGALQAPDSSAVSSDFSAIRTVSP
ncbi:hypothetical protein GCM10010447_55920 [Streptomyces fulvorobeus]